MINPSKNMLPIRWCYLTLAVIRNRHRDFRCHRIPINRHNQLPYRPPYLTIRRSKGQPAGTSLRPLPRLSRGRVGHPPPAAPPKPGYPHRKTVVAMCFKAPFPVDHGAWNAVQWPRVRP
ncbi:hypothetical protein MTBUT4_670009 [Magnetospirillum sp. UT-4]|nr:hypothetical protein MTBUT4_670009 [Magnetospirillum sp. UT-4]